MIHFSLIGNATADTRQIGKLTVFDVAINVGEETTYITVKTVNEKLGPNLLKYVKKGTKVYVEGSPYSEAYLDKSNIATGKLVMWARRVEFLSSVNKEEF